MSVVRRKLPEDCLKIYQSLHAAGHRGQHSRSGCQLCWLRDWLGPLSYMTTIQELIDSVPDSLRTALIAALMLAGL